MTGFRALAAFAAIVVSWSAGPGARAQETPAPGLGLADIVSAEEQRAAGQLAALEARIETARQARQREEALHAERTEAAFALAAEIREAAPGSAAADALYERLVTALRVSRPALRDALERVRQPVEVPPFEPALDPAVRGAGALAEPVAAVDALYAKIDGAAEILRNEERRRRWTEVELRGLRNQGLDALRVECLSKLSAVKRAEILGFSEAGIAQLRREVEQLALTARFWLARRTHGLEILPGEIRSVKRIGALTWLALQLALLVSVWLWARRRWTDLVAWARRQTFPRLRTVRGKRRVQALMSAFEAVGPWTLFLVALRAARWVLGPVAELPEIALPYRLLWVYGVYRLGIDAVYALVVGVATRYRMALDAARRNKLLKSVRAVARLTAAIVVLLELSALLLGRGYLYHLVVRLAWVFGLAVAYRLLSGWREVISEAYLKASPTGALADAVRRTHERWYGIFVAGAAFVLLFGRGLAVLAKDFALGFDQTRKALAFLFRRRMEKQAERRGYAESRLEDLPPELVAAFTEEPVSQGPLVVENFPGLDELSRLIERWKAGGGGGSFLVTGEPGIGKSSWLRRVGTDGVDVVRIDPSRRLPTVDDLTSTLAAALVEGGSAAGSLTELSTALERGPRRIVTLDGAHNLFLAKVGGYAVLEAFVSLVEATSRQLFWVCTCDALAWTRLAAVRPDLAVFRGRQDLRPWSESQIRDLIRTRIGASGVVATYEDLVIDRLEGVSTAATLLVETEGGYARLLWDYTDGNPRAALHWWLRSVVPDAPRRVRVRLFRAPEPEVLERGGEQGLLILAALVNHENLTLDQTVATTRYPEALCKIHLSRFRDVGALTEFEGRYSVTTAWQRSVMRLLARRNLIPD